MKEQLQQIQAVAIVTCFCVLIAVHSDGDYGKWFVVEGVREDVDTATGNSTNQYSFQYNYYLGYYEYYNSADRTTESVGYGSVLCLSCSNQKDVAGNIKILSYGTAILAFGVAYMAYNSVKNLHTKGLKNALKNLKYSSLLVVVFGILTAFLFYSTWPQALIDDETTINTDNEGIESRLGCIVEQQPPKDFNFYNKASCEEYIPSPIKGNSDLISARINPVEWQPGIGFFVVIIGSLITGGGTLYILGSIDEEWQAVIKKQELIERQQKIQDSEIERNKDLLEEFERTEESLKEAEKKIDEVRSSAENVDYKGIDDLEEELDRLTALNQSVNTLNNTLENKLKSARIATAEVEKRARMAEKELNDDISAKTNLEMEIEDLRGKHENDMRLSDRMTREIGSLRKMGEDAEDRASKAEKQLKLEKPDTVKALESYDSVKASYDKTVQEKNNLEKEIMELEQQSLEANEREKAAIAEKNDAARRRKEMDMEVKLMDKNKKRLNDKFATLTANLEAAKKELNKTREGAAVALNELDIERETIVKLEQEAEKHREKEREIVGMTDSMKELQEQIDDQKKSNSVIEEDLKVEVERKRKTEKDVKALERASKQVSRVMKSLKKQFDNAKEELGIAIEERNKVERTLQAEREDHEKLKEDLDFLQNNTIGSEEDTERKIKAIELEKTKATEESLSMKAESEELIESNQDLQDKIKEARMDSIETAANQPAPSSNVAAIGSSLIVKNLTKETEHNFELVNPDQADIPNGKIPLTNPIGKSLEGSKEGDEVKVGPTTFKVLKLK